MLGVTRLHTPRLIHFTIGFHADYSHILTVRRDVKLPEGSFQLLFMGLYLGLEWNTKYTGVR